MGRGIRPPRLIGTIVTGSPTDDPRWWRTARLRCDDPGPCPRGLPTPRHRDTATMLQCISVAFVVEGIEFPGQGVARGASAMNTVAGYSRVSKESQKTLSLKVPWNVDLPMIF